MSIVKKIRFGVSEDHCDNFGHVKFLFFLSPLHPMTKITCPARCRLKSTKFEQWVCIGDKIDIVKRGMPLSQNLVMPKFERRVAEGLKWKKLFVLNTSDRVSKVV